MFGYVKEYAPELKVKEYNLYKAVYCGLCKSMGKCCGNCSRFTLSYDITFLSVFRLALEHTEYEIERKKCIVHPFKKRAVMKSNSVLEYCARVSALLSYAKLKDDIADNGILKKIFYTMLNPFFYYAKCRAGYEELYRVMRKYLSELSECEKNKCVSIDGPADIFGRLTAEVFSYGLEDVSKRKIAYAVGFYTGKWIYAADALDDMTDDVKSGSYNPFVQIYGRSIPEKSVDMIKSAFTQSLVEIEKALELADFTDASLKALIFNIVYEGMNRKSDEILSKAKDTKLAVENRF